MPQIEDMFYPDPELPLRYVFRVNYTIADDVAAWDVIVRIGPNKWHTLPGGGGQVALGGAGAPPIVLDAAKQALRDADLPPLETPAE